MKIYSNGPLILLLSGRVWLKAMTPVSPLKLSCGIAKLISELAIMDRLHQVPTLNAPQLLIILSRVLAKTFTESIT